MLHTRYELVVPRHLPDGTPTEKTVYVTVAERLLAIAGGFSRREQQGSWTAPDGRVHADESFIYVVDVDRPARLYPEAEALYDLARWVAHECEQETVYLTMQPIQTWEVLPLATMLALAAPGTRATTPRRTDA